MFGFISINKPHGVTSRFVVDQIGRFVGQHKVGHCGTLDPIATGVLVLGIGSATRLVEFVQQMPKSYRGTFLLGCSSETLDIEGDISHVTGAPVPSIDAVQQALKYFHGNLMQQPPQYSAIKVQGRRAYNVARSGKQIVIPPREVTIYAISLVNFAYPELTLEITCSGGTYVRAIGRDLATRLKTSAVMKSLCRTAIGDFKISESHPLERLDKASISKLLISPEFAVNHLEHVDLSSDQLEDISHGRKISIPFHLTSSLQSEKVAAFFDSHLVAILQKADSSQWIPHKVFIQPATKTETSDKV
ncbi:MAG: tRNA pseudouridine(55) synthase TruB [Planctomycetota bacterium]|nr:tRNA pseudouridine(55) synthase TruB [Planctomycetota bacterium]